MTHQLAELLTERVASSLRRKSIVSPAKWATEYRVMGKPFEGPWTFKRHPWLKDMHLSEHNVNVGQKAAQMGFTENVLNVVFFYIDIHQVDCLYVLPSKTPDASDFSAARFDTALELSNHLRRMFSDVRNVGHKRAGNTNLYIRGAKSRSGLKSVPVGVLILDEKDEMNQDNIPLARERQSGYNINKTWEISTPTIDNFGINETFKTSTQNEFFFKCPSCNKYINLTWPESIEICGEDYDDPTIKDSFVKCSLCQTKLHHETKPEWLSTGRWIEQFSDKDAAGWGINQLYSSTVHPSGIVASYYRAQTNPADEQEFHNSKLGQPHIVDGAKVTEQDLDNCIGDYLSILSNNNGLVTMGVDVGTYLHYEIDKWQMTKDLGSTDFNINSRPQVLAVGKCQNFEDLDRLMQIYNISGCVIDMQPERRKAFEFATRFWGRVHLCVYARGISGKNINKNTEELTVSVDRTSWLDLSQGRFKNGQILLPKDLPREYKRHIMAIVRVYEKDVDGNPVGKYVKAGSNDDHFAHARNYSEIALPLAASIGAAQSINQRM
jgi:hypothetical protein